jgi:hypothetical protein
VGTELPCDGIENDVFAVATMQELLSEMKKQPIFGAPPGWKLRPQGYRSDNFIMLQEEE